MNEKITVLGAWGTVDVGETSSFLIETPQMDILLDMCPGVARQLKRYGYQLKNLTFAYGSHVHADHLLGATYLLFQHSVETRGKKECRPIHFLGSENVLETIDQVVKLHYPDRGFEYQKTRTEISEKITYNDVVLRFAPNHHVVDTRAIRIDLPSGKSICYTADGIFTDEVYELADHVDLLIGEAFGTMDLYSEKYEKVKHSLAVHLGHLANQCKVKRIIPFHMNCVYDIDAAKKKHLYDEIRENYAGEIVWPQDLKTIYL